MCLYREQMIRAAKRRADMKHASANNYHFLGTRIGLVLILIAAGACGRLGNQAPPVEVTPAPAAPPVANPPPETAPAKPSADAAAPVPIPGAPATGENPAESPEAGGTSNPNAADVAAAPPAPPAAPATPDGNIEPAPAAPTTPPSRCPTKVPSTLDAGLSDHCLSLGQGDRMYKVYKPSSLSSASKAKAVAILLHGGGGGGAEDASNPDNSALAVFTSVADREQIVVVYPQGRSLLTSIRTRIRLNINCLLQSPPGRMHA